MMSNIFYHGDFPYFYFSIMVIIALVLIFVAFKAPRKVKTIGLIGLAIPIAISTYVLCEICVLFEMSGDLEAMSVTVFAGGIKTLLFLVFCGVLIFIMSLVLSLFLRSDKK